MGITHSMGPPHSPQLNGKAERFNRTILDRILPTLFHSKLPVRFWEDAARNSLTGLNSSPSRTNPGSASPISLWEDKSPSYSRLRTFGCKSWRMVTGPTRGGKLASKSVSCIYLYTLPDGDGWMAWDTALGKSVKSHDVLFLEDQFPGLGEPSKKTYAEWSEWNEQTFSKVNNNDRMRMWERRLSASIHNPNNQPQSTTETNRTPTTSPTRQSNKSPPDTAQESADETAPGDSSVNGETVGSSSDGEDTGIEEDAIDPAEGPAPPSNRTSPDTPPDTTITHEPEPARRGTRVRREPQRYGFLMKEDIPVIKSFLFTQDPQSYKEAVSNVDRVKWLEAMNKEMQSLRDKDVFELVPLPKGKRAIGCRWHYITKFNTDKTVDKLKARWVAKGFLQRKGVDFDETYAPSTKQETIRMVLSHMAIHGWDSQQMDVMTAFLNSLLQHEVYLKQPEGFVDAEHPEWVWRVKASLYGLRQAPREWHLTLKKELESFGMKQSQSDPVLYIHKQNG